jgi:hypothetical protein
MVRQGEPEPGSEPAGASPGSDMRSYPWELQRSVTQLEVLHARMELPGQRDSQPGEIDQLRDATLLAVWGVQRIVRQPRDPPYPSAGTD